MTYSSDVTNGGVVPISVSELPVSCVFRFNFLDFLDMNICAEYRTNIASS